MPLHTLVRILAALKDMNIYCVLPPTATADPQASAWHCATLYKEPVPSFERGRPRNPKRRERLDEMLSGTSQLFVFLP